MPQDPEGLVPHDAAEPGWKRDRIGKAGQRRPSGHESLLHDILGLLKIAHERQRRAKREVLEPPRQLHEGFDVATGGPADKLRVIHCGILASKVPGNGGGL